MNENDLAACKTVVSRHYKIRLTSLQYLEDYSYSCKGKLMLKLRDNMQCVYDSTFKLYEDIKL